MKKIVIFASGAGSNAEKIIEFYNGHCFALVASVFSNNDKAKVLEIAKNNNIATVTFNTSELEDGFVLQKLVDLKPDLIVLAGFLRKFPLQIITTFKNKVINIHPALLPKYGGKGMYGLHVHKAVLENKESESGITIHYINENYDEGAFICQKSTSIIECKTPEEIAVKILQLEHLYFAQEIEKLLKSNSSN